MKRPLAGLLVLAFASALPAALAAPKALRLGHPFVLNGVVVEPGEYQVELSPSLDTVKLMRGKSVVVTAPCKARAVGESIPSDAVFSHPDSQGRDEIVRLVLASSRMSIEMMPSAETVEAQR